MVKPELTLSDQTLRVIPQAGLDTVMTFVRFARTAMTAGAMLGMTLAATSSDEAIPQFTSLNLPPLPEIQPLPNLSAVPGAQGNAAVADREQALPAGTALLAKPENYAMPATASHAVAVASLGPVAPPPPVAAPMPAVLPALQRALQSYAAGSLAQGDETAKTLPAGIAAVTAEWAALRTFPRQVGYARIMAFLAAHSDWPSADWLSRRAEEALYGDPLPPAIAQAHFSQAPPRTAAGKLALAKLRSQAGDTAAAAALVRNVWRHEELNKSLEKSVLEEYSSLLTSQDHKFRADRFLYKEDTATGLRLAAMAGSGVLALAKARAAVIDEAASDALFASVPKTLAQDPGLTFSAIQKLRRAENPDAAAALLLSSTQDPDALVSGDEWWVERRLLARAMLDRGETEKAWRLCAEHSAQSVSVQIEAEFHAGWIALRYLDNPTLARGHFARLSLLAENASAISRGAYWLGRSQEALGDKQGADALYAKAARHPTQFYGQVAKARLGQSAFHVRPSPSPALGDSRAEAVRVLEQLQAAGLSETSAPLAYDLARNLLGEAQLGALADVVARSRNAAFMLQVGKIAAQRGIALDELAFPDFGVPDFVPLPGSADRALVYSIVRQESAFVSRAASGAGAKGLMQLMPPTARKTAEHAGVPFDAARLTSDPAFNIQLGAAHLGILFGEYDGSYVLTFAAYNAGGARVKEWIAAYGDPRRPDVDVIDWIEHIPITETRYYVQHILENLQVYRARFGDQPLLRIEADLHARGGRF